MPAMLLALLVGCHTVSPSPLRQVLWCQLQSMPLLQAVSRQPVISAINVNADFMHYAGGVYSASSCSDETVNHAVLAVGYR